MARVLEKLTVALATVAVTIVASPSCSTQTINAENCDYVATRCRTYCDYCYGGYYYGYYGCCYDRCWYECIGDGKPDKVEDTDPPPAPAPDAGPSTPPPATDGGSVDVAVLCAPCTANDECKGGGLCIIRGGEDAGANGFCGVACSSSADCPADFTCTEIGSSKQCVPTSGNCN